ncbi:MAG: LVIVD repeat-containing protein [Gemmatimonadaceae bacterium]
MPPVPSFRALRAAAIALSTLLIASPALAQGASTTDPRATLKAGWKDAGEASWNLHVVSTTWKPEAMYDAKNLGNFSFMNSDLAFSGKHVFQGNFNGFQIWDASDVKNLKLTTLYTCPGGQGDLSVWGNLLFMSVEETRGRVDCAGGGVKDTVSAERFRGVRIFDISDIEHPKVITQVQTCRGSHTHTLVEDPRDTGVVYIFVQGTSVVRSPNELAGCSGAMPDKDPNTALFRIEVIRVPLANPAEAKIVNSPRIFADSTGAIAGLWKGGEHGAGTQATSRTDQCHDITAYPAIGLAAGACSGNGIILDIKDPANPKRIAEVMDPNFAYWHSANFSNDGSKVLFTDEWGGGVAPRCRASDKLTWGADAIFTVQGRKLTLAGYYKLPVAQTNTENCVAHNGAIIPVPGRDIMAQGWYQGGVSVFDFSDPAHVREIAYFDRGPLNADTLHIGGSWSAYWHNGYLYSSEIARGLDILELTPSEYLSANEIAAAKLVQHDVNNPQNQMRNVWPAQPVVARAYLDQIVRYGELLPARTREIGASLDAAEAATGQARTAAYKKLAKSLTADAKTAAEPERAKALAAVVAEMAK